MLIDNFWKILFVLMVIGGLVLWYNKHRESSSFKSTAAELSELIAFGGDATAANDDEAHQRFIKAITLLHTCSDDGIDPRQLVDKAHEYNEVGTDTGHASLINASLFDNLRTAEQLGIFEDENVWTLEDGQPVKINNGPFKGEEIAVTYHVPASVGPGARFFLGNLVLVPESVADAARDLEITEDLYNTSIKLVNANIITKEAAKAIKTTYYLQREKQKVKRK